MASCRACRLEGKPSQRFCLVCGSALVEADEAIDAVAAPSRTSSAGLEEDEVMNELRRRFGTPDPDPLLEQLAAQLPSKLGLPLLSSRKVGALHAVHAYAGDSPRHVLFITVGVAPWGQELSLRAPFDGATVPEWGFEVLNEVGSTVVRRHLAWSPGDFARAGGLPGEFSGVVAAADPRFPALEYDGRALSLLTLCGVFEDELSGPSPLDRVVGVPLLMTAPGRPPTPRPPEPLAPPDPEPGVETQPEPALRPLALGAGSAAVGPGWGLGTLKRSALGDRFFDFEVQRRDGRRDSVPVLDPRSSSLRSPISPAAAETTLAAMTPAAALLAPADARAFTEAALRSWRAEPPCAELLASLLSAAREGERHDLQLLKRLEDLWLPELALAVGIPLERVERGLRERFGLPARDAQPLPPAEPGPEEGGWLRRMFAPPEASFVVEDRLSLASNASLSNGVELEALPGRWALRTRAGRAPRFPVYQELLLAHESLGPDGAPREDDEYAGQASFGEAGTLVLSDRWVRWEPSFLQAHERRLSGTQSTHGGRAVTLQLEARREVLFMTGKTAPHAWVVLVVRHLVPTLADYEAHGSL